MHRINFWHFHLDENVVEFWNISRKANRTYNIYDCGLMCSIILYLRRFVHSKSRILIEWYFYNVILNAGVNSAVSLEFWRITIKAHFVKNKKKKRVKKYTTSTFRVFFNPNNGPPVINTACDGCCRYSFFLLNIMCFMS